MKSPILLALLLPMLCVPDISAQMRPDVAGTSAALSSDHPLATEIGARVLRNGGNAMDAAIAMAAALGVVRPHMNGVGGDAFMLFRDGRSGRVYALNGSGRAPALALPDTFRARGLDAVPETGLLSVTVPGAVRLWSDALRRFGTIDFDDALAPAIDLAEHGFPVSAKLAADINAAREKVSADSSAAAVFLLNGEAPAVGSVLRQVDLARSLRLLARDGPDALYAGDLGVAVVQMMQQEGGLLRIEDLIAHSSTWQDPIEVLHRDHRVLTFPPNSQGMALLLEMNLAEGYDLRALGHNSAQYLHTLVELKKLAFAERDRWVTDPTFLDIPLERLLSREHARELLSRWAPRTEAPDPARDGDGDTVYLCVVDKDGNAVSLIQSLYHSFGSGRMVPGTGIVLHNRGALFSLDAQHVNVIAPNKRTYHTLAPAMSLNRDGSLHMLFGTPGSDGQAQTLLQVFNNITLFGMTPQQAVEAPRYRSYEGSIVGFEPGIADSTLTQLEAMGHQLRRPQRLTSDHGGAQVILLLPGGVLMVGSDPRREAYGVAW